MELYFAQIREDSRVERDLMQQKKPAKVTVIGSGGCTAFSILTDAVEKVYCIDLNPAQCALVELKKAGIRALDRQSFLAFIGEAASDKRAELYQELRKELPGYAKEFWDANPEAIETGINKCGVTERFYAYVSRQILENIYPEQVWERLFNCSDLAEQKSFYEQHFAGEKWRSRMLPLLSKTAHLKFFPAFMFAQAQEDDFGRFFLNQFEHELQTRLVRNNYFLSQFLFGRYIYEEAEGMPFYLTHQGFEDAKKNLDKLEIIPDSVEGFLQNKKGIDAYFLSNVFDWSTEAGRSSMCKSIIEAASAEAMLLYRNMLSEPPLPAFFSGKFKVDNSLSEYCRQQERSMLYRKITVAAAG